MVNARAFSVRLSLSYNDSGIILSETNADTELCKYSKTADNPEAANTKGLH